MFLGNVWAHAPLYPHGSYTPMHDIHKNIAKDRAIFAIFIEEVCIYIKCKQ